MEEGEKVRLLLEKIKNGSVLSELTEYEELPPLTAGRKKTLDIVTGFNNRGRFPTYKQLKKSLPSFEYQYHFLRSENLMFNATMVDICGVFAYRKGYSLELPLELNDATWNDIKKLRCPTSKGGTKSWDQKLEFSRAPVYPRYLIALISKNNVPVFRKAFAFLDYLKNKPESKQPL